MLVEVKQNIMYMTYKKHKPLPASRDMSAWCCRTRKRKRSPILLSQFVGRNREQRIDFTDVKAPWRHTLSTDAIALPPSWSLSQVITLHFNTIATESDIEVVGLSLSGEKVTMFIAAPDTPLSKLRERITYELQDVYGDLVLLLTNGTTFDSHCEHSTTIASIMEKSVSLPAKL